MKSIFPFFTVIPTLAILWVGCAEEGSDCAVACQNGGTCIDYVCDCPSGFSGSSCQTNLNELLGDYIVNDNCTPGTSYIISIAANSQSTLGIIISNIGNHGIAVLATIDEEDGSVFDFSPQNVTINGSAATIIGGGVFVNSGSALHLNYTTSINGNPTVCSAQ